MIATAQNGIQCPRCHRSEVSALAREGDLQRYQCVPCSENFTAPYIPDPKAESAPPADAPPPSGAAYAPIAPPDPGEQSVSASGAVGSCPKCKKPYLRLGKRYEEHVAACDGTPYVEKTPRTPRVQVVQAFSPVPMPAGAEKAIDLSIEALKAQRSVLEGEIRGIDGAIATLEKIKGGSSRPLAAGA